VKRTSRTAVLDTSTRTIKKRRIEIDLDDLARLEGVKIFAHRINTGGINEKLRVVGKNGKPHQTTLGRFIMKAGPRGRVIKLGADNDYRKESLRLLRKDSKYIGVISDDGGFAYRVFHEGGQVKDGPFATEEEAARAFDLKSIELKGEGAKRLNFDDSLEQYRAKATRGQRRITPTLQERVKPHKLVSIDSACRLLGMAEEAVIELVKSGDVRLSYHDLRHERWPGHIKRRA